MYIHAHTGIEIVTMTMCIHILCLLFYLCFNPLTTNGKEKCTVDLKRSRRDVTAWVDTLRRENNVSFPWRLPWEGWRTPALARRQTRDLELSDVSVVCDGWLVSKSTDNVYGLCLAPLHPQQQLWQPCGHLVFTPLFLIIVGSFQDKV